MRNLAALFLVIYIMDVFRVDYDYIPEPMTTGPAKDKDFEPGGNSIISVACLHSEWICWNQTPHEKQALSYRAPLQQHDRMIYT